MTARYEICIFCEACGQWERIQSGYVTYARKQLREQGWRYRARGDYCPACVKKEAWKKKR